jgi:hypothetical protein
MEGYAHDAESAELSADELAAYGEIVRYTCMPEAQNQISCFLSLISGPQGTSVLDFVSGKVGRMWRTELRV